MKKHLSDFSSMPMRKTLLDFLHVLIAVLVGVFLTCSCSSSSDNGGENSGGKTDSTPTETPKPTDGNDLYGLLTDNDGKPVKGVTVSDGYSCVQTDSRGFYQMKRNANAHFVFYSTPSDCKARPTQFYQRLTATTKQYDFKLTKEIASDHFVLIAMGDPQVTNNTQLARFKDETMADLKQTLDGLSLPACGIALGDIVNDKPDMMATMRTMLSSTGMPFFSTIGNHDKVKQTDTTKPRTTDNYERSFGPLNYSFNRGQVHFICLDNVVFSNADEYAAGISDEQIAWMKADLQYVPTSKMVVVYYHIPMRDSNVPGREAALALLKDYPNVKLMCGHTHYLQNYQVKTPIQTEERIHGTACGAWWHSVICTDGTPNGYAVYEIQGNKIVNQYYKPTHYDKSFQMRLFHGNASFGGQYGTYSYGLSSDYIVANVFNYDPQWHVSIYEDGKYSGEMTSALSYFKQDAWAVGLHLGVFNRDEKNYGVTCYHDFVYKLKNPKAKVKVEAVDEYGNTYTQETFTTSLAEAESYGNAAAK